MLVTRSYLADRGLFVSRIASFIDLSILLVVVVVVARGVVGAACLKAPAGAGGRGAGGGSKYLSKYLIEVVRQHLVRGGGPAGGGALPLLRDANEGERVPSSTKLQYVCTDERPLQLYPAGSLAY